MKDRENEREREKRENERETEKRGGAGCYI